VIKLAQTKVLEDQIIAWFSTQNGQLLLQQERQAFERLTRQVFGFQLLQLGILDKDRPRMAECSVKRHTLIGGQIYANLDDYLAAEAEALPVLTDSTDAVLLPHTLDFCVDPQKILLEVDRILIPEGKLVISGFNPISLWGVARKMKSRRYREIPWNAHFVSYTRLHDWLLLLGFDVEQTEVMMFRPPAENATLLQKLDFMEKAGARLWPRFGGVYMIKAVKRVSTLTPIKPVWKRRPRLLAQVIEPSTRGVSRGKT